ncbi:Fe-S cluster assembly protein NifU [Lapidilactobacillus concavus DSM 17758]|jgi:nitrogen fixation NifU-like protein|uniref:Fe-S cluster assembly protein NifU n=1 Tax=Lapidilactobacillus concavus DSM 17758 TaxID=1423735 RepID=A0A0R1WAP9_9LACO|nr:SUF system NifU family Fe-S cluster assembly protein [Lapidilactobacillus concavus]KRM12900.1 Fe-S cluster assembly protein NifU [Lapidilactobacillus concavus DSM 17758]GEL13212.1 iron-sulfur cluster assembly scaffold protein [Lapidilactobacillus concavus]
MNLGHLSDLYRQLILDHAQHPHHRGQLATANQTVNLNNPTCGDVIELSVELKNDRVADIAFNGDGCSISQASASMMTDLVKGQPIAQVRAEIATFLEMLMNDPEVEGADELGDAAILATVVKFPARIKCATLAWKALEQALGEAQQHE